MNKSNKKSNTVVIHPHVDLDACACVAFSGVGVHNVRFLRAAAKELPQELADARVLDHPLGLKGKMEEDGTVHAAALSMEEAMDADPWLLTEIDAQDKDANAHPHFTLAQILVAVRVEAERRGIEGEVNDREVVKVMSRILRGLNLMHADRARVAKIGKSVPVVGVNGMRIAILPIGLDEPAVGAYLSKERGVQCAIYQNEIGIGITRYPGHKTPDLRLLTEHLPGWFVHSAGFLACFGSRKSPADGPPPAGTPQSQRDLLALAKSVFGKKPEEKKAEPAVAAE